MKDRTTHSFAGRCLVAAACVIPLLALLAPPATGGDPRAAETASQLQSLLTTLPHTKAVAGACVIDVVTGETVFAFAPDKALIPASTMKVFVMTAGLDLLGGDFHFDTVLATDRTHLFLVGGGDPALGDAKLCSARGETINDTFARWADALVAADMTTIPGDLVIDESIFDAERTHPSWEQGDLGKWYAAPIGALNFNDNCVDITVSPVEAVGAPVTVSITPDCSLIEIVNKCRSHGRGTPLLHHAHGSFKYRVTGRCPKRWPFGPVAFPDPGLLTAHTLRTVLNGRGVTVLGDIRRGRVRLADGRLPDSLSVVATHTTPICDLLLRIGKNSQNLFADCLTKRLGYEFDKRGGAAGAPRRRTGDAADVQGSWPGGADAVVRTLTRAGIDLTGFSMADGSGLSRDNRCTARQLATALAWMHGQPEGAMLRESLSIAGVDGSLKKEMRDTAGRVHGKTGTMRGVRALAGYVDGPTGPRYAFAIMFNDFTGPSAPYKRIQNRFCGILANP